MDNFLTYLKPSKQKRQKRRDKRLHKDLIGCYRRAGDRFRTHKGYLKNVAANNWEDSPQHEGMKIRFGWYTKFQYQKMGPLTKYLFSKTGQHWGKVYSAIKHKCGRNAFMSAHIDKELRQIVAINVEVRGDYVIENCDWGGPKLLYSTNYGPAFYICPKNGTLKIAKHSTRKEIKRFVHR